MIPTLDGVHHVKLPVTELDRSIDWYRSRFGYQVVIVFRSEGKRGGVTMAHPDGGPMLGLVESPEKARAAAGFDYFSVGVPDRARLVALAEHLTRLGEQHAGVHFATAGWILPMLHDPDGHEIRFYSTESHTDLDPNSPLVVDDVVATSQTAELAWLAERGLPAVVGGSLRAADAPAPSSEIGSNAHRMTN
jgi:catechol 2,3-dioxygenase-like lactoylglutathione lyase family enzyme